MALIAVGSAKGAPGATTTALALAAAWPRQVVLVDGDPAGGDVGLRLPADDGRPLDRDRGLISLAAAARRGLDSDTVRGHLQRMLGGLDVLTGLRSAEQAAGLDPLWPGLGTVLRALPETDVIVDVGRVGPSSPTLALMRSAQLVVLVSRTDVASLFHTRERLDMLTRGLRASSVEAQRTAVVLVAPADRRREAEAAREVFARQESRPDAVWTLPVDQRGARLFEGEPVSRPERTDLVRSAARVAVLAADLAVADLAVGNPAVGEPESRELAPGVPTARGAR